MTMCDKQALMKITDKLYCVDIKGRVRIGTEYNGRSFIVMPCTDGIAITIAPYNLNNGVPRRVSDGYILIGAQYAGQRFSKHKSDDGTITLLNRSKVAMPDA